MSETCPEDVTITLKISRRDNGGIRVRAQAPFEDVYLAGTVSGVAHDLGLVIRTILVENHGVEWLREGVELFDALDTVKRAALSNEKEKG
jgi:hypothetical protein